MTERLDAAGCRPLPEEAYPRSLVGVLPAGKRVDLRVDVPNKHDENSAAVAYFQVSACMNARIRVTAFSPACHLVLVWSWGVLLAKFFSADEGLAGFDRVSPTILEIMAISLTTTSRTTKYEKQAAALVLGSRTHCIVVVFHSLFSICHRPRSWKTMGVL